MSRSDDLRLLDILDASDRIARLVARGHAAFDDDESLQPAIERMLEIIGESANALSEEVCGDLTGIDWEDIRRLRIVLAHHYHRVDPDQVWTMATQEVPATAALIRTQRPELS